MKQNNRGSRNFSGPNRGSRKDFRSQDREMHKTKCADCGAECEVPFKPKEDRPVYCRECYEKHKPQRY